MSDRAPTPFRDGALPDLVPPDLEPLVEHCRGVIGWPTVTPPIAGSPRLLRRRWGEGLTSVSPETTFALVDGDTFARIRRRLHLTQAELAREIGCHRVSVANWEAGHKPISATIARLMTCLNRERKVTTRRKT
jgi:DNA-binding transcriptional regulator YiaG